MKERDTRQGKEDDKVKIEELLSELDGLKKQVEEFENNYKRALADYQNLQKREQAEKSEWIKSGNKELILRILPVLDTLMLAQQHVEDQGLQVSVQQFLDTLKSEGVTRIETVGHEFDPHLMECVTTEEGDKNKVIKEIRAGFKQYERVLRVAQVTVGEGKENSVFENGKK